MQPDELDQRPDLRLSPAEENGLPMGAEAPREHCEIHHQRCVREHEFGEVDDNVRLGAEGTSQCLTPAPLRRSIFVASNAQNWRLVNEVDDRRNLHKPDPNMQAFGGLFHTLGPYGFN
jgi:hypothetical protein